ncbi:helix-turn-helix domain-containing protein [Spirosoma humi]
MRTLVIPVSHPRLKPFVQSFLFFCKRDQASFSYTTFPNTNLCLAIYKNNQVTYRPNSGLNLCGVKPGQQQSSSRLYGFHQQPFTVDIQGEIDQVCILFRPAALRAFTAEAYDQLFQSEHVLSDLFGSSSSSLLDQLFSLDEASQRASVLEAFLVARLQSTRLNPLATASLQLIGQRPTGQPIEHLAATLRINPSTLYRLFMEQVGQSPKLFEQTVRFRHALTDLQAPLRPNLTQVAYSSEYYDQAHCIKHIKQLTGYTPKQLRQKATVEQNELIWITTQTRAA